MLAYRSGFYRAAPCSSCGTRSTRWSPALTSHGGFRGSSGADSTGIEENYKPRRFSFSFQLVFSLRPLDGRHIRDRTRAYTNPAIRMGAPSPRDPCQHIHQVRPRRSAEYSTRQPVRKLSEHCSQFPPIRSKWQRAGVRASGRCSRNALGVVVMLGRLVSVDSPVC